LHFAALGAAVASFMAKRWWTNSLRAAVRVEAGAGVGVGGDAWARLRAGCLITWAISEAVAIIGLVAALLARRPAGAVPLAIAAALLLYLHRPAAWPLEEVARQRGEAA
jgi:crotonobetainyl-CoA:carnitine CoA-transferase CaiB-like acyl-CoA transferase